MGDTKEMRALGQVGETESQALLLGCVVPRVCAPYQGPANFVKDQKVYRFYGLYSLCSNDSVLLLYHAGIHRQHTNKWLWLCSRLYL